MGAARPPARLGCRLARRAKLGLPSSRAGASSLAGAHLLPCPALLAPDYDLLETLVTWIDETQEAGAILVFLPGGTLSKAGC